MGDQVLLGEAVKREQSFTVQPMRAWMLGKEVLTAEEIAGIFGRRPFTVRRWCRKGILPARRLPHDWVVTASALEGFSPPVMGRPKRESRAIPEREKPPRSKVKLARLVLLDRPVADGKDDEEEYEE